MNTKMSNKRIIIIVFTIGLLNWSYYNRTLLIRPKVALAYAIINITGNSSSTWGVWGSVTASSVVYLQQNIKPFRDKALAVRMLNSSNAMIRSTILQMIALSADDKVATDDRIYKTVVDMAENDYDFRVRGVAIYSLGWLKNKDACEVLKKMYSPINEEYKGKIGESLKNLDCPNITELLKPPPPRTVSVLMDILLPAFNGGGWHRDYTFEEQQAENELGILAAEHTSEFLPYLKSPNAGIRIITLDFIASTKNPKIYVPIVIKVLETDPIMDVRIKAARTLGDLGDKRACPILAKVLKQKSFGKPINRTYHTYNFDDGEKYTDFANVNDVHDIAEEAMNKIGCF